MMSILSLCNSRLWVFLAISCLFFVDNVYANPELVADINLAKGHEITNPNNFIKHNDVLIFSAETDFLGRELWATDGVDSWLLKDIYPGSRSGVSLEVTFTVIGDELYFAALGPATGLEIWKTDGTPSGTMLAIETIVGPESRIVRTIKSNASNTGLYFIGRDDLGQDQLWRANNELTVFEQLTSIPGNSYRQTHFSDFVSFTINSKSIFVVNQKEIWVTDGSAVGTLLLDENAAYIYNLNALVKFDGALYFSSSTGSNAYKLWKSDGTQAGTELVLDIHTGSNDTGRFIVYNSELYFSASDSLHGHELWKTDGTTNGTVLVSDTVPGSDSGGPAHFSVSGNSLLFTVDRGRSIWKTDGTPQGTMLVKEVTTTFGGRILSIVGTVNGNVYYRDNNSPSGIWITDGSIGGTEYLDDFSIQINNGLHLNNEIYYSDNAGIWKTDGTKSGTVLVADYLDFRPDALTEGAVEIEIVENFKGKLYLRVIRDIPDTYSDSSTRYVEFMRVDPSDFSMEFVDIINANSGSRPESMIEFNGLGFFIASNEVAGREMWVTNGSEAWLLADINPGLGSSNPRKMYVQGNYLYFIANDGVSGDELWRTDGTMAGTILLKDIAAGSRSSIYNIIGYFPSDISFTSPRFVGLGDELFFVADSDDAGIELWKTDGTVAGTDIVKNINPGNSSSYPGSMVVLGDEIYFSALNAEYGRELWKSDGTESGTQIVANIVYGKYNSSPAELVALGDYIYFKISRYSSAQNYYEQELWVTDGTEAGTQKVGGYPEGQYLNFLGASENKIYYVQRYFPNQVGNEYIYNFYVVDKNSSELKSIEFRGALRYWSGVFDNFSFIHEDELYISADNGLTGKELWKISTVSNRFELVKDFTSDSEDSEFGEYLKTDNGYYILINHELWLLDNAGVVSFQDELAYLPIQGTNTLLYSSYDPATGAELWAKKIGINDQQLLRDIYPGTPTSLPKTLAVIDHSLYFTAIDDIHGRELWRYDLPVQLRGSGVMGDFVWEDSNGNGVYDSNESGLSGVSVDLLRCNRNIVDSVTTDADGQFQFTGINVGDYQMRYHLPTGYRFSPTNKGGNYRFDSNANALTGLTPCLNMADGQKRLAVDAGMIPANTAGTGSMGDFVWHDINSNGIQDNNEPGLTNVSIELQTCSGVVVDTETSNADGGFSFAQIPPGDYQMRFQLPSGYSFSPEKQGSNYRYDSNVDPATGLSPCLPIDGHQRNAVDAGMISHNTLGTGSMGDFVWDDLNGDGIQDANEPGMINVIVDLQSCSGEVIESAMTDTSGNFLFTGIATGDYQMYFHLPTGYDYSPTGQGSDYRVDSNVNRDTGLSPCLPINDHRRIAVDAGMMR